MNLEKEIPSLEKQFWQAMIDKDTDLGTRLTSDPRLVTGAQDSHGQIGKALPR